MKWQTEQRKVSDLVASKENPRQMTEKQVQDLTASLQKFDLAEIPAVTTHDKILAGHQRLKIMAMLGRGDEVIDVRVPDRELTAEEEREYLIRSNRNTGEWDWDALANEFDLDELTDWGFEEDELGVFDVDDVDAPELSDGDREPFRQATFTLHDEQWEEVEAALKGAKADGHGDSAVNENSNGNALAWIAQEFNRGKS